MWCDCKSTEVWVSESNKHAKTNLLPCDSAGYIKIETNMGTGIFAHLINSEKNNI